MMILILVCSLVLLPLMAGALRIEESLKLISAGPLGLGGNWSSEDSDISADGTKIVFSSWASNLVGASTDNDNENVFLFDTQSNTTTLISAGSSGLGANGISRYPSISADGTKISFASTASDLVGAPTVRATQNIFVYDTVQGLTKLISMGTDGEGANDHLVYSALNADGTRVVYSGRSTNLVSPPTTNIGNGNVFLYDYASDTTTLVTAGTGGVGGNEFSYSCDISDDGTTIAFWSRASNLVGAPTTNGMTNIFTYDIATHTTALITKSPLGAAADGGSQSPSLNANGTLVAFASNAKNLREETTAGSYNIFVYDSSDQKISLVTGGPDGEGAYGYSRNPVISADGSSVAFDSNSDELLGADFTSDERNVFLFDRTTATLLLLSVGSGGQGGDNDSYFPAINGDGTRVSFDSYADDLVGAPTDNGETDDVFLWSRDALVEVSFDTQGGTPTPDPASILQGTAVSAPKPDPTKTGFVFAGWWTQAQGGVQWNFSDAVTNDMTLFAHWTPVGNGGNGDGGNAEVIPPTGDGIASNISGMVALIGSVLSMAPLLSRRINQ
jgi:uncharacterized repeat protein (TIGR02543 family)